MKRILRVETPQVKFAVTIAPTFLSRGEVEELRDFIASRLMLLCDDLPLSMSIPLSKVKVK